MHRAQLAELDRDLADGRIGPDEHAGAKLEVQRRLLAESELPEVAPKRGALSPILLAVVLVPAAAVGLYLVGGVPDMPSAPFAEVQAERDKENAVVTQLRARLALMDPHSEQTRRGYMLLGNAEEQRGHWNEAAAAFQSALAIQFDPTVAARAAESIARASGAVTQEAAALYRQALAAAPADAPWRALVEERLKNAPPVN